MFPINRHISKYNTCMHQEVYIDFLANKKNLCNNICTRKSPIKNLKLKKNYFDENLAPFCYGTMGIILLLKFWGFLCFWIWRQKTSAYPQSRWLALELGFFEFCCQKLGILSLSFKNPQQLCRAVICR